MRKAFKAHRRAILMAAFVGVIVLAIGALIAPVSTAAGSSICTYYNNAAHTTVVGKFGKDCCNNNVAWGVKTAYSTCGACFVCVPPPR